MLTQDIKGGQYIKFHPIVDRGGLEHKAECTGVRPFMTLDLKLYGKYFVSLTGFQLVPDFLDELSSALKLLLKTSEVAEEDDEVSIRAASEGGSFA